jgi:hypothetical protein
MSAESAGFRVVLAETPPLEIFNSLDGQFKKCHENSHLNRVLRCIKNMENETSSSVETYQHRRVAITNLNTLKQKCVAYSLIYEKIQNEFKKIVALAQSQADGIQLLETLASDKEQKGNSSQSSAKTEQETELDKQLKILKNQFSLVTKTSQSMERMIRIVEQKLKIFNALVKNKGSLSVEQLEEVQQLPFTNFQALVIDRVTIQTLIKAIEGRPSRLEIPVSYLSTRTSCSSENTSFQLTSGSATTKSRSPKTASPVETLDK